MQPISGSFNYNFITLSFFLIPFVALVFIMAFAEAEILSVLVLLLFFLLPWLFTLIIIINYKRIFISENKILVYHFFLDKFYEIDRKDVVNVRRLTNIILDYYSTFLIYKEGRTEKRILFYRKSEYRYNYDLLKEIKT